MVSIPEGNFVCTRRGAEIFPRFLQPSDHPWLRELLGEVDRSVGLRLGELEERLASACLGAAPEGLRRMAQRVLLDRVKTEKRALVSPKVARAELFRREPTSVHARDEALARTASRLSLSPAELMEALFADLPKERRILGLEPPLEVGELAIRTNLAFAQALLFRAHEVRLQLTTQARALVRQAQLGGLIVAVEDRGSAGARLHISGPLSLFRRTLVYGHALSRLVPLLAWAGQFTLEADLMLSLGAGRLRLQPPLPIFPAEAPRTFDSKLEARFARAFARAAPDWELLREPEALRAGGGLIFPDFVARHRHDPGRRVYLELVGFWTPAYLAKKLEGLRKAGLSRLVLCVDESLGCADGELPRGAEIVWFRRKVDPGAVLRAIAALERAGSPSIAASVRRPIP